MPSPPVVAPPASSAVADVVQVQRVGSASSPEDPDDYRMTFGEHLDELRMRLIRGLAGFIVAFLFCLAVARDWVFTFLAEPYLAVMRDNDLNPQFLEINPGGVFATYLKLSAIAATVIASPWLLWQVWMFVAAGLYPRERRTITRHIPLSVALLIGGVSFAYYVVLPMTLSFLIAFTVTMKLPTDFQPVTTTQPAAPMSVPIMQGDPPNAIAPDGGAMIWFNQTQSKLKVAVNGHVRVIQYASENLVSPFITLTDYTDMLLMLLLTFGLSFQTPLAVVLLVRVGIFELAELKQMRRVVYFVLVILSSVITPGDAITATVALVLPLCALYELGLLLARSPRRAFVEPAT